MDPLRHLLPAVYQALSATPLAVGGASVPVFQHLPKPQGGHYVRLHQPRAPQAAGASSCYEWSCTLLVDVVTQFPTTAIDTIPAGDIADQILTRLHRDEDGQRPVLPLPTGWQCGPATVELNEGLDEPAAPGNELAAYRRLIRLRWPVFYHVPATPQPEPDPDDEQAILAHLLAFPIILP